MIAVMALPTCSVCLLFFNDTATTEIYTLSLHDALPISAGEDRFDLQIPLLARRERIEIQGRSEEHTSELQSRGDNSYAVLCLEKNKNRSHARLSCWTSVFGCSSLLRFAY